MTQARELLAQAADELGYTQDAQVLRAGRGAFIQVTAALRAIERAPQPTPAEVAGMVERLEHFASTLDHARAMAIKPEAANQVETTQITSTEAVILAGAFREAAALIERLAQGTRPLSVNMGD